MSKQERAAQYYMKGMTLKAIANRFHVSHVCIRNWLLKQGVTMRPKGRVPAKVS
jgi:uncharacterized protein YjcR